MRRLLTGYAISFNRRHHRHGHLFQNRYKSILCQEDTYLIELVRYIHLNPLRAGLVQDLKELDYYAYSGHSRLMAKIKDQWQDVVTVLALFGKQKYAARKQYRVFVEKGILDAKKPELTGGGLIRSAGGWGVLKSLRRINIHFKSDERILGDSDFVEKVLCDATEKMERRYRLEAMGYDFDTIVEIVSDIFKIEVMQILSPGKHPKRVMARSVLAYWSVRELGISGTKVGRRLSLSQSAISRAVQRGEHLVAERKLSLSNDDELVKSQKTPI